MDKDKKVVVLSDSFLSMFFFGLGNLTKGRIERVLNSPEYDGYEVKSVSWKVNRFLLFFARQSVYLFLQKV